MRTCLLFLVVATVVIAAALSLGEVRAADPPAASRGRELCFELADGTVITGRIDAKVITFRAPSGNVLKVPVADLTELSVGLNKQRGSVDRAQAPSKIQAGETTLLGTVTVKQFRLASPYGGITVKLDDIHRIRPAARATASKFGRWAVKLRVKTRLRASSYCRQ